MLNVFKSTINVEEGVSAISHSFHVAFYQHCRISCLCGGFSGLLWGLLNEISRVKLFLREGGAELGNGNVL